jgi:hypothetical protein
MFYKKIKLTTLTIVFSIAIIFASCGEDNTPTGNNPPAGACGTGNLCFKLDSILITVTADWREINPTRYRIQWEETTGMDYRNIEIDIYGNTAGSYPIDTTHAAWTSGFQYYTNIGGTVTNWRGVSGSVELGPISSDNKLTGTFSGTVIAGSESKQVNEGNFVSVPK